MPVLIERILLLVDKIFHTITTVACTKKRFHTITSLFQARPRTVTFTQNALLQGRSSYDDVRVLDFGKIAEASSFVPKMTARVTEELDRMHKFNTSALASLSIDPNQGDTEDKQRDLLLKVNSCIYDFKQSQPEIELKQDVLRDAIVLLQKHGVNMDKSDTQMTDVVDSWGSVKKQVPVARELGVRVQEREALKIKNNITIYENARKTYAFEFGKKPLFDFATGVDAAYQTLNPKPYTLNPGP